MRADARANRTALIRAAQRLFAMRGPGVPFSAIAQEAGVGIGTLYRHFPTQDDLVAGVVEHLGEEIGRVCDRWSPDMSAEPHQTWPRFVADLVDLQVATFMPRVVEGGAVDVLDPLLVKVREDTLSRVEEILDMAKGAGLVDPSVTVERFHLGLAIATRPLPGSVAPLVGNIHDWLVDVYLRGLRP